MSVRIANTIASSVRNKKIIQLGEIVDVSKKGKHVKVKLLPVIIDDDDYWMPYVFPYAGKDVQLGGMPIVGSRVLVFFVDKGEDEEYSNTFALGGIFDTGKNTKPTTASDSEDDRFHFMLKPPNGGSIEMYKSGETHKIRITGTNDIDVVCDNINLGNVSLTDEQKVVVKKFIQYKYNAMVSQLNEIMQQFYTTPFMGDSGILLPLAVRNTGSFLQYLTWAAQVETTYIDLFTDGTVSSVTKAKT